MNNELIERLAREAGHGDNDWHSGLWCLVRPGLMERRPSPELIRFAALVAEECAKACEPDAMSTIAEGVIGASRARAIRAKFPMP